MGLGRKGTGSDNRAKKFYDVISEHELYQCMNALSDLLKPNSHLYMMCDDEVSDYIKQYYRKQILPFNYCKRIVWDKIDRGLGYHYRGAYEFIVTLKYDELIKELQDIEDHDDVEQIEYVMFLEKGKRKLNDLALPDVVHFKRVQGRTIPEGVEFNEGDPKHYPTEKPYALVEQFILNSTGEGDWVLDQTMGSGVVAEVCLRNNRNFVGIDKSEHSIVWTHCRLSQVLKEMGSDLTIQASISMVILIGTARSPESVSLS